MSLRRCLAALCCTVIFAAPSLAPQSLHSGLLPTSPSLLKPFPAKPWSRLRLRVTAYAIGDGFTPSTLAADGKRVWIGTVACSPDLKAALWGHRIRLRGWTYVVRDLMASGITRSLDVFVASISDALQWGVQYEEVEVEP